MTIAVVFVVLRQSFQGGQHPLCREVTSYSTAPAVVSVADELVAVSVAADALAAVSVAVVVVISAAASSRAHSLSLFLLLSFRGLSRGHCVAAEKCPATAAAVVVHSKWQYLHRHTHSDSAEPSARFVAALVSAVQDDPMALYAATDPMDPTVPGDDHVDSTVVPGH